MGKNHNLKITTNWRPVAGQPSPLWRRLWARLLMDKKGKPASQAAAEDAPTRSTQEDNPRG